MAWICRGLIQQRRSPNGPDQRTRGGAIVVQELQDGLQARLGSARPGSASVSRPPPPTLPHLGLVLKGPVWDSKVTAVSLGVTRHWLISEEGRGRPGRMSRNCSSGTPPG